MGFGQKYAVLNDRLLPEKVADLLLDEQIGSSLPTAERSFIYTDAIQKQIEVRLLFENHNLHATSFPFTERHIEAMIEKMLRNNGYAKARISIRLYAAEKAVLYIKSSENLTDSD